MAATLRKIKDATVPLAVQVTVGKDEHTGDLVKDAVQVRYRWRVIDGALKHELAGIIRGQKDDQAAVDESNLLLFCRAVAWWDLRAEEGDAEPIPLTVEGLRPVPDETLTEILAAIREDRFPKETTATD